MFGAIMGLIITIIWLILLFISIALRMMASGVSITRTALRHGNAGRQPDGIDMAVDGTAWILRMLAKIVSVIRKLVGVVGGGATIVVNILLIVVIAAVSVAGVILSDELDTVVENQMEKDGSKTTNDCSANWVHVPLCVTVSKVKTYEDSHISRTDYWSAGTNQNHFWYSDAYGKVEEDNLGFHYIEDKDPDTSKNVRYYAIATSPYFCGGEIGVKFRITLEGGKIFYAITGDTKSASDSTMGPGDKSPELEKSMSESEKKTNPPNKCAHHASSGDDGEYDKSNIIEFIIDVDTAKTAIGESNGYVNGGSMNEDFDSDHQFSGTVTKVERLDPNASPGKCKTEGISTEGLKVTGTVIWVGDSRFKQLAAYLYGGSIGSNGAVVGEDIEKDGQHNIFYARGGKGFSNGLQVDADAVAGKIEAGVTVVVNYGVNDLLTPDRADSLSTKYSDYLNELAQGSWSKAKIVYMSVNPGDSAKAAQNKMTIDNQGIQDFNAGMKEKLSSKITYLNTYDTYINHPDFSTMGGNSGDGVHYYQSSALQMIQYDAIRSGGTSIATAGSYVDYSGTWIPSATGVPIDFTDRYYLKDSAGIKGTPDGPEIKEGASVENTRAIFKQSAYAAARAWDVSNHYGMFMLPSDWTTYAEKGKVIKEQTEGVERETSGIYAYRANDPLNKSILVYRNKDTREVGYGYIEYVSEETVNVNGGNIVLKNVTISETSGRKDYNYGYKAETYSTLEAYLAAKNAELVYMFRPNTEL